jgi:uncharacterized protein YejL (UPF0352 family)
MPIPSKYSTAQIETLMNQLLDQLRQQQVTTEMSLMVLGNMVSHIIRTSVPDAAQKDIAGQFAQALQDSVSGRSH